MSRRTSVVARLVAAVPKNIAPGPVEWARRHRWIMSLVWLHVPAIMIFGLARGETIQHTAVEATPVALLGILASQNRLNHRLRAVIAALALITSSAVLVHLSGGMIEMHFHFFVMLGVISLYQSWLPFLMAIG